MDYPFQLGGGCELALMADILLAAPNAQFGQPEVNIGTITGGGGSQRLARVVGKSRAMELTLTGRMWDAREAAEWGMASRVVGEGEARPVRSSWRLRGRARLPCRRRRRSSMLARPLVFFFPVWSWFYTALILYVLVCVRAWWFSV